MKRLQAHHDNVTEVLDRARLALMGSDFPETAKVAQLRWELMRVLREYQLFKHAEVFDPLIRAGEPHRATAEALKERCLKAAADYEDHVHRWTLFGLVDAWPQYRGETLAVTSRLVQHLAVEIREVRGLLARMERTR